MRLCAARRCVCTFTGVPQTLNCLIWQVNGSACGWLSKPWANRCARRRPARARPCLRPPARRDQSRRVAAHQPPPRCARRD
eukprot:3193158-Prymnesium_polylepis.1